MVNKTFARYYILCMKCIGYIFKVLGIVLCVGLPLFVICMIGMEMGLTNVLYTLGIIASVITVMFIAVGATLLYEECKDVIKDEDVH